MTQLDGWARSNRWTPPPRPDWVARTNAEGEHLDLRRVVPLDERSLLDAATSETGLDDFGADDWREPFSILCRALDDEAKLNLTGRLLTRTDILLALQARLRIEETYKRHPEIEDERIERPLMIVGQGRSGTTQLQHLLAEDPESGTIRGWEVCFPCPPPEAATYRTDPRIERAENIMGLWSKVTPEIEGMHEFGGWAPTEDVHLQALSFRMTAWIDAIWGQVPSFAQYLAGQDLADAYRYEKRVLKVLQWRNPRRRWILKSPFALSHLPKVVEVFPDIGFVWPHRDPLRAVSSMVSFVGALNWMRSDHPLQRNALDILTNSEMAAGLMTQPIRWLEQGALKPEALCHVRFRDLVSDPLGTIGAIYRFFGLELSEAARVAMQRHMAAHPRSSRPGHQYDLGTTEEIELERAAFAEYQRYFDVPDEVS